MTTVEILEKCAELIDKLDSVYNGDKFSFFKAKEGVTFIIDPATADPNKSASEIAEDLINDKTSLLC